ncbi:SRPBCC family protein [Dactylosporangium roseum]|uniref:SRPBCC family protein n=1 Tax=Dactylosporangium roseum TaxID=47989 RepID=A0ABY5Z8Y8_9ACTN|nr:SRPBCC family protein [Dactylosporangium roseum]UWZ38541.1 SRPBCC family protein [Dactylosporangium roseum]
MLLEHSFTVPVPVEQAWNVLLDIERVAPCLPGATLTSVEGERFTGTVKVKLGPVSLTFKGSGRFVERDEAARRVQLTASGVDARGGGTAAAKVTASLHETGDETRVEVTTDLDITGKAAQFGRGLIGDVSGKLIGQFAACLAEKLAAAEPAPPAAPPAAATPAASQAAPVTAGSQAVPATAASPAAAAPATALPVAADPAAAAPAAAAVAGPAAVRAEAGAAPAAEVGAAAAAGAGASASGAGGPTVGPGAPSVSTQAPVAPVHPEAEPIDLLAVTGVGNAVRRAVPYVLTAAASFAVVLGIIWWIKRR